MVLYKIAFACVQEMNFAIRVALNFQNIVFAIAMDENASIYAGENFDISGTVVYQERFDGVRRLHRRGDGTDAVAEMPAIGQV